MSDEYTHNSNLGLLQYLARDTKHETEKPYCLYYEYDFDIPRTNTAEDNRTVCMRNARHLRELPGAMLSSYGFYENESPMRSDKARALR